MSACAAADGTRRGVHVRWVKVGGDATSSGCVSGLELRPAEAEEDPNLLHWGSQDSPLLA